MSKFDVLAQAIEAVPKEHVVARFAMNAFLERGRLDALHMYALGLLDMAAQLTGDEALLRPLREIREALA